MLNLGKKYNSLWGILWEILVQVTTLVTEAGIEGMAK